MCKRHLTHCQRNANNRQTSGFQVPSKLVWSDSWMHAQMHLHHGADEQHVAGNRIAACLLLDTKGGIHVAERFCMIKVEDDERSHVSVDV